MLMVEKGRFFFNDGVSILFLSFFLFLSFIIEKNEQGYPFTYIKKCIYIYIYQ